MIRGAGGEKPSTYSQTLNRREEAGCLGEAASRRMQSSKWAIFGKQNWRCGMNRKLG